MTLLSPMYDSIWQEFITLLFSMRNLVLQFTNSNRVADSDTLIFAGRTYLFVRTINNEIKNNTGNN